MRVIVFGFILPLFFLGCAIKNSDSSVLHQKYSQYEKSTNKNYIIAVASDFFSPSLLGADYQTNPDAASQLLFKNYMASEVSHYEKTNGNEGCLTINGYGEDNAPLIFSLKYISAANSWLIDDIHVVFVKSVNDFANSAKCPNEYPQ